MIVAEDPSPSTEFCATGNPHLSRNVFSYETEPDLEDWTMSNPRREYRGLSRRYYDDWDRWGEDYGVGLLIAGFVVLAILMGLAAWHSHKVTRTASLLNDIEYQSTRPNLPTIPY